MQANKIEFKILTDENKDEAHFESMSPKAAKSLSEMLESIIAIVSSAEMDGEAPKIYLNRGSIVVGAPLPPIKAALINNDFKDIVENKSEKINALNGWRKFQSLVHANGLTFQASIFVDGQRNDVTQIIKESRQFKKKRVVKNVVADVTFIKGKLTHSGGEVRQNMHIDDNGTKYIVQCEEDDVRGSRNYLKDEIMVSSFVDDRGGEKTYYFCDVYKDEGTFFDLAAFYQSYKNSELVDALVSIHRQIKKYVDENKIQRIAKLMALFDTRTSSVNTLKTFLIATQSFEGIEEIDNLRKSFNLKYDSLKSKKN